MECRHILGGFGEQGCYHTLWGLTVITNIIIDTFHTENLSDNQELLELAIISFIFMTFTFCLKGDTIRRK